MKREVKKQREEKLQGADGGDVKKGGVRGGRMRCEGGGWVYKNKDVYPTQYQGFGQH